MAELLNEPLGKRIGFRVRFDQQVSRHTRIEVVTEGILTRRLQQDPELEGVGLVIFDEFHERSLQADLALALCLDVADGLRDDLRLLVMSATLEVDAVSKVLGGVPVVHGHGRSYPVETHYLSRDTEKSIPQTALSGIHRALNEQQGDLLVFLPGAREIRAVASRLEEQLSPDTLICPLYGDLGNDLQLQAIRPDPKGRRRVVLSTSIAETSLTIEGMNTVVDGGWSRQPRFDPNSGLTRLITLRLSRASAEQRAGRAGRLRPGVCYRLWTKAVQSGLNAHTPPEIQVADLAPLVLELAQWGVSEVDQLSWMDPPPKGAVAQARELLQALEGLDKKGRITAYGRRMLSLPLHPRLAHMLLLAVASGQTAVAADIAALLSERDILQRSAGIPAATDIDERLQWLRRWRDSGRRVMAAGVDVTACTRVDRVSRQLRRLKLQEEPKSLPPLSLGGLLASAYPDRVARRRGRDGHHYQMASGRGVHLPEGDSLGREEFLVVAHLDAGRSEGRVYLAAAIDVKQIRESMGSCIALISEIVWETRSRTVVSRQKEVLGAVVLSTRLLESPDPEAVKDAMLEGIRTLGLKVLPWDRESQAWRARLMSLRGWQPEAGWPDLSDRTLLETIDRWLAPWLQGITRPEQLKRLNLEMIFRSGLDWEKQQRMEQLAPTHIRVPSGSYKRLEYRPGEPPVLKVKLQEMFGLAETPTVCSGRVALVLHLLSPAQRPIQVTRDLEGFWGRTYQEVKRELKGRYPKHYWPDDPWEAIPTARVRPRK
jgi:ATP-dependent helicase HrpB